jgi:sulfite reductase (NADPH) hemoprotein beta-component
MYKYDEKDQHLVEQRVQQFRNQTDRYLSGQLSEDDFRTLRLQNGLYLQRHSPMLRVAIPYGILGSYQLRKLAEISRKFDKGYGHFTTRQNIQFNWPSLVNVPDILAELAKVQMHSIQTSGNCIRNTTTDQFAGVAHDEIINPLVWCEIIRQWSVLHPEFAYLPRKFKIAVSGAKLDRAAVGVHDIGIHATELNGEIGFRIWVGGGLGRTPLVGHLIKEFVSWQDLLTYLQAILRVYNLHGRRDNKYKARIKILVKDLTPEIFKQQVELLWEKIKSGPDVVTESQLERVKTQFSWPTYQVIDNDDYPEQYATNKAFKNWINANVHGHKVRGYASVTVSLKAHGEVPGDISADQMECVANLADAYSFKEVRVSHEQNIVLADVRRSDLYFVWQLLDHANLATANIGYLTNIISCPGMDYCNLANAASIPLAKAIQERFSDLDYLYDIGPLDLNISGCMNACSHHHIGHIGILGVDKNGEEWYQITIGGRQNSDKDINELGQVSGASIGKIIGPSFKRDQVPDVIELLISTYLNIRESAEETFIDVVNRVGIDPFKKAVYPKNIEKRGDI